MKQKTVLIEIDERANPIRILKFRKMAWKLPVESVREVPKAYAVEAIRTQVFARAGCTRTHPGECEWCGRPIIWEAGYPESGHMHERIPKGKMVFQGPEGEVSVENSVAICDPCHLGPNGAHGNRRWHSAKLKNETKQDTTRDD